MIEHWRLHTRRDAVRLLVAAGAVGAGGRLASASASAPDAPGTTAEYRRIRRHDMNTPDGLGLYHSPDRDDSQGPRLRSNVEVVRHEQGAFVRIHTRRSQSDAWEGRRWASGGLKVLGTEHRYGIVRCRLRLSASYGTRGVALYWPDCTNCWPERGELDFFEVAADAPQRRRYRITNHFADDSDDGHGLEQSGWITGDFTRWHVFEVHWRPDLWVVRIDGRERWRTTRHVPNGSMWLGMQTALGTLGAGQARTPTQLDVDWAEVYELR